METDGILHVPGAAVVGGETQLIRNLLFLPLLIALTSPVVGETPRTTTRVLQDGTTILETRDETDRLLREEVVLRNGRHKTTYFDGRGDPHYSVVTTGTGSFGIMYYEESEAPLFKFWHYGNDEKIIQFHSDTFDLIGSIEIQTDNAERRVVWSEETNRGSKAMIWIPVSFLAGALFAFLLVRTTTQKTSKSRR